MRIQPVCRTLFPPLPWSFFTVCSKNRQETTGDTSTQEPSRCSKPLTVLVEPSSVHLVDDRRHLVPLTLGPVALHLRLQPELGEGNPGCHRRSVPVVTVLPGHDGSNCGLEGRNKCVIFACGGVGCVAVTVTRALKVIREEIQSADINAWGLIYIFTTRNSLLGCSCHYINL